MKVQQTALDSAFKTQPIERLVHQRKSLLLGERKLIVMLSDLLAVTGAVILALAAWAHFAGEQFSLQFVANHYYWFIILISAWWLLAAVNEYYQLSKLAHPLRSLRTLLSIDAELLMLYFVFFFAAPPAALPRLFILFFAASALLTSGSMRMLRFATLRVSDFRRRVLIVGAGSVAHAITRVLKDEASNDYEIVGCVTSYLDIMSLPAATTLLGFGAELPEIVERYGIVEIIMAYINEIPEDIFSGLLECYYRGVTVMSMPQLFEQVTGRMPIEHVEEHLWSLVLPIDGQSLIKRTNAVLKRMLDCIIAGVLLVVLSPLVALAALAIKLNSAGPILFRQQRVGERGQLFTIIKLRTMRVDAEALSGPVWASSDDTRITRVGRFLRRSRIDEIPQLINVLRGEMSMVGPRPERPEFVDKLAAEIPFYKSRLVTKPGLTGWAQIRYRYGGSVEDALYKLQFDLYYIRHQSLLLDVLIMARTATIMLRLKGT